MVTLTVLVLFFGAFGLLHLAVRAVRGLRRVLSGATPASRPIAEVHHT